VLGLRKYSGTRCATTACATDFVLSCMALDKALGLGQAFNGVLKPMVLFELRQIAAANSLFWQMLPNFYSNRSILAR
jgi:hypothetical protein